MALILSFPGTHFTDDRSHNLIIMPNQILKITSLSRLKMLKSGPSSKVGMQGTIVKTKT